jgi:alanine racemase
MNFEALCALFPDSKCQMAEGNREIHSLFYDSRLISNGLGGVFFAIVSERSDGHRFIPQVAEKGVKQWIISDPKWADWLTERGNQNWLLVDDVVWALQLLSAYHRSNFSKPVIGITGSNGKTIVKEWLSQLLAHQFFICKSPKSFNSQIGVPLSVWNLSPGHHLGIFEAGVSKSGEMKNLQNIIQPDLGILTSLGPAHSEGFSSEIEKFKEKCLLFQKADKLVLSQALFEAQKEWLSNLLPATKFLTWYWKKEEKQAYILHFQDLRLEFDLPFTDMASLENLGNAISMSLLLGVSASQIQKILPALSLPQMRLSLKEGNVGNQLIDDSYTNDLAGLEAALQFARLQRREKQKLFLVLSDLEETRIGAIELEKKLTQLVLDFQVNGLITIGKQFSNPLEIPGFLHQNFESAAALLQNQWIKNISDSVLLIKGARKFGLENLVKAWQKKVHGTRLEINLDAMVSNLNFYKSQLPKGTGIMAMVKALGYGSGGEEIARLLEFHNVEYLAVAYADEGIKLRESGVKLPIMVMNPMPEVLQNLIQFKLEPEIYNFRILEEWIQIIENQAEEDIPSIHLKLDTGMHRLGFFNQELERLVGILRNQPKIKVASVFSHMAAADEDRHQDYSLEQIRLFEAGTEFLKKNFPENQNFKRHLLNSAGILRYPEAAYDLVRLGIGLYGIEVNSWYQNQLLPVSVLKTTISQIKSLKKGETVGYGRKGVLNRDSEIATIAIGYADGFRRDFSLGKGKVKIKQEWVPVVGNVCMDMTMVDVSGLDAEEGEEVIIFEDADSLMRLAEAAETIPYEILTGIGHRVKRIFYRE